MEGAQTTFYKLNEQGGTIGRHSANQIIIMEESVSRSHAEIVFRDQDFFIRDTKSSTGSFIKIQEHQCVFEGMIFEMGSN
jgi:pSer/pThr/pTyr-binding forkhead associated (FHA) protein